MTREAFLVAIGALALVSLGGCDKPKDQSAATAGAPTAATLTGAIGGAPGMSTVAAALKSTGLATVFDGTAPYTVLVPQDDAFGKLGDAAAKLKVPENGAAMAAVLKAHVLPGYMTVGDIGAALTKAQGKPVRMTTMAGTDVTFSRAGDAVAVTAADGSAAKISGSELTAGNGVAIPIDAVLKAIPNSTAE